MRATRVLVITAAHEHSGVVTSALLASSVGIGKRSGLMEKEWADGKEREVLGMACRVNHFIDFLWHIMERMSVCALSEQVMGTRNSRGASLGLLGKSRISNAGKSGTLPETFTYWRG
ncbi:hypothetical protein EVAR_5903_1 [Eumeta japonica]|uniref:Uncharacterized protein n=1 Tax=Eumeta variegata TaxID=151549 RepID=A0A4C1TC76_EUMVA|nr:hypothetical protein EVAR_5903_1 [Eumeta japonica]